ncbi:MAG: hypothetical protein P8100_05670 [bacterium]
MSTFVLRITASHTVTYFLAGLVAMSLLKYDELFSSGSLSHMRSTDSVWIAAGPALQIIRGFFLGISLYPFRSVFLETKFGWGKFWFLIFGLTYLFTFAAAVGSFEGFIYTNYPIRVHLLGLPEVLLYVSLFTIMLWAWYKKPVKAFTLISVIATCIVVLLSIMGMLVATGVMDAG